jgi:uncharacterized membrane protein
MGHGHGHPAAKVSKRVRRALILATLPFALATVIALIVLWPAPSGHLDLPTETAERLAATVADVEETSCEDIAGGEGFKCSVVTARLDEGPDEGDEFSFDSAFGSGVEPLEEGDRIIVGHSPDSPEGFEYFFLDYQRGFPLLLLAVIFGAMAVLLSRWKGLAALAGLAISMVVLIRFIIPAILEGSSPLLVAIVGSAAIMLTTLYLAHGVSARTTTAILGTLVSLLLTGLLAVVFVDAVHLSGIASEEAAFLQISAQQINLEGLLLGGIMIGALGVLDDVTVTQASAVWELHAANPAFRFGSLYRSAVRIGRDHIASTVNTLVLAYAGASLPLLILLILANRPLGEALSSEVIAVELVRTLVGSIGLIASVPLTTALAAFVATRDRAPDDDEVPDEPPVPKAPKTEKEWQPGRREREFWTGETKDESRWVEGGA